MVLDSFSDFADCVKIDSERVNSIFRKLCNKKAWGPDGLSFFLLNHYSDEWSDTWLPIFELFLEGHSVPALWKKKQQLSLNQECHVLLKTRTSLLECKLTPLLWNGFSHFNWQSTTSKGHSWMSKTAGCLRSQSVGGWKLPLHLSQRGGLLPSLLWENHLILNTTTTEELIFDLREVRAHYPMGTITAQFGSYKYLGIYMANWNGIFLLWWCHWIMMP